MELTWCAWPAQMRHGTQGHVEEPREPMRRTSGAQVARTRGTTIRVHADARVVPRGMRGGAGKWRAHELVGLSEMIEAVTQMRYAAPHYILDFSLYFLRVGLRSLLISSLQATWQHCERQMRSITLNKRRQSCGPESTQSPSKHVR